MTELDKMKNNFQIFCDCNSLNDLKEDPNTNTVVYYCNNCNASKPLLNSVIIKHYNLNDNKISNIYHKDDIYQRLQIQCINKKCTNLEHVCIRNEIVNCIYVCLKCNTQSTPNMHL